MKKKLIAVGLFCCLIAQKSYALELSGITVEASKKFMVNDYTKILDTQTTTQYNLDTKAIKTFSGSNNSVFNAINMIPSVNTQGPDAYGNDETLRLRGIDSTKAGIININGVPTPNGPTGNLTSNVFDLENIQNISVYDGAIKPNIGFNSFGDFPGIIDLTIKKPSDKLDAIINQSFGSYDYSKSFVRLDSGNINGFRTFISSSLAYANKWKGDGNFVRKNVMFGLTKNFDNLLNFELYLGYNSDFHNTYLGLNYSQASNVNQNYALDYNNNPNSPLYYNYNYVNTRDYFVLPSFTINTSNTSKLVLKPYYWSVRGHNYYTSNNSEFVQKFLYNSNIFGIVSSFDWDITKNYKISAGYWFHKQQMPGPPYAIENFVPKNNTLVFKQWGILADHSYHTINSPFINIEAKTKKIKVDAGLKYLMYKTAQINGYNTYGITTQDANQAISLAKKDQFETADAKIFRQYLPYIGINYQLNDYINLYANYGKSFQAPNFNLWPSFAQNKVVFEKKGITLQSLWDKYFKMTTADNFDIGLRYNNNNVYFYPTVFYSDVKNIGTYAPIKVNNNTIAEMPANTAKAKSYGFELAAGYTPFKDLLIFADYSYNRFYYTQNVSFMNNYYDVKGKQIINVPKNILKAGFTYKFDHFSFTPYFSYMSKRYGDLMHTQEVPSVFLANLNISYEQKNLWKLKEILFSLDFTNLLNRRYISAINAPDSNFSMYSQTTYQVGAPFSVVASLSVKF
ncbi:MAG: TonB-dependent receptor [Desulfurella sp.]